MVDPLVTASIVLVLIGALILGYLGMKYPRGRKDWPHDGPKTFRLVTTTILFFIIMGLVFWITRYWDYPVSGKSIVYLAAITLPILIVIGFVFPKGKRGLFE